LAHRRLDHCWLEAIQAATGWLRRRHMGTRTGRRTARQEPCVEAAVSGPSFDRTAEQSTSWSKLPSALHDLWDTCMQNQGGTDVARALTMNLLCIADASQAEMLRNITQRLQ